MLPALCWAKKLPLNFENGCEVAKTLRLAADYFAEFPLWSDDGRYPSDLAEQLPLSTALVQRIRAWALDFNEHSHGESPSSDADARVWDLAFDARGQALADELGDELGSDYEIEYGRITDR